MSNARLGMEAKAVVDHACRLLREAQVYVDRLNVPHIGARLQEVIDQVEELALP